MSNLQTPTLSRNALAYPALTLWRAELARGYRGQRADRPATWHLDALWRAACWEATAQAGSDWNALRHAREVVAAAAVARYG